MTDPKNDLASPSEVSAFFSSMFFDEEGNVADNANEPAEAAAHALAMRRRLLDRGIPAKDMGRLLGTAPLVETEALAIARKFIADPDSRILVMAGPRGVGKTTAAAWLVAQDRVDHDLANPTPEEQRAIDGWRGDTTLRGDATKRVYRPGPLFRDVSELIGVTSYDAASIEPLKRARLLAIDELGEEYVDEKGFWIATFSAIFNARYAADLRTVITTNLTGAAFEKRYGRRVADRMTEVGSFIELTGESMRGRK